jgi:hypothetical protein
MRALLASVCATVLACGSAAVMRLSRALVAVVAILAVACDGPDAQFIVYENRLPTTVFVYEYLGGETTPRRELPPGGSFKNQVLIPRRDRWATSTGRRIEAVDGTGRVVYCQDFTFPQLEAMEWRIKIEAGKTCVGPP